MFAAPIAAISPLPLTVSPLRAAKVRESTAVSVKATSAMPAAGRASAATSAQLEPAERGSGEALRQRTDHRQPVGEPEDGGERGRPDDCDEHARGPAIWPR